LALVELLPEAIQQQVREGMLGADLAMKYLAPVARINLDDCQRMAAAFVQHRCDTRQAGQLYAAWREGSRVVRERILTEPELSFENAAAAAGHQAGRSRTRSRSGDGGCHSASRQPAPHRGHGGDDWPATGTSAEPDRKRAPRTRPDGGANRKGTGSATC
jgi:hypothetical protein